MGNITILSDENFDEAIKANKLMLVDFWAAWCMPCKMIAPILEEIARENQKIAIGKLNIDENPIKTAEFQVMAVPMLILFKEGKAVSKIVGAMPKDALIKKLEPYLE